MKASTLIKIEIWNLTFASENLLVCNSPYLITLGEGQNPSELEIFKDKFFSHSTSWRFEIENGVVLTFISLNRDTNAEGSKVQDYLDQRLENSDVLRHALRHLSFLTYYDSSFTSSLKKSEIFQIRKFDPLPAGLIYSLKN